MGHPFFAKQFKFSQPDGTTIGVVGWGNDVNAVFETLDGYTIYQDPTDKIFYFAELHAKSRRFFSSGLIVGKDDPESIGLKKHLREDKSVINVSKRKVELGQSISEWRKRRLRISAVNEIKAFDSSTQSADASLGHITGSIVGLCIPIEFIDEPAGVSRNEIQAFCNGSGYTQFGNNGSVREYFLDVSNQKLDYTNLVTPIYRAKNPKTYYTDPRINVNTRTIELIEEALAFFVASNFPFDTLSISETGSVYALNLFYAGGLDNNYGEGLWPHQWHLDSPINIGVGVVKDYQITNMGSSLSIGTFCHESGHLICNFPDLYDTDLDSAGVGIYCLMGLGGTHNEKNPTEPCALLKYLAGWYDNVFPIYHGQLNTLQRDQNEIAYFLRNANEYLMFEHRTSTGRDSELPSTGLAVWHVDLNMDSNDQQHGNVDAHYLCSLVQADGQFNLEWNVNPGDDRDLFGAPDFPDYPNRDAGMKSKWWDGKSTGLTLSNIQANEQGSKFAVIISDESEASNLSVV